MSDILADRFLAIADFADDGDWGDVRRRAGANVRRRRAAVLVAAAALVVTAVAIAAGNGWVFKRPPLAEPSFARTFSFHGASWSVVGYLDSEGRVSCYSVGRTETLLAARTRCRTHLMTPPGVAHFPPGRPLTLYGSLHGGGQILLGDARSSVARVSVTDTRGRTVTVSTTLAPTLPDATTRVRLWLIVLPSSRAISIAAYDRHGRRLFRGPPGRPYEPPGNVFG